MLSEGMQNFFSIISAYCFEIGLGFKPLLSFEFSLFFLNHIRRFLAKKNPLFRRRMAGGLRAETRPPGQEEGSGRDRPTRGLWDSLSLM